MRWPSAKQYAVAWQNPEAILRVKALAGGTVRCDDAGMPIAMVGGFGAVFDYTTPDGQRWAIKCFHKKTPGLRRRYRGIAAYLAKHDLPQFVKFTWHEHGLELGKQVLPLVQMPWIEGYCLHTFLQKHHDSPEVCEALYKIWLKLVGQLRASGIAHGDLQHHNIILVPEGHMRFSLKLVDLDGMWIPSVADLPSYETGHRAYQHPYRMREPYHQYLDRFPTLVIALTLAALREEGAKLWPKFHIGRNLIFRALDYLRPDQSRLLTYLRGHPRPEIQRMANALLQACSQPPDQIPWVDELLKELSSAPQTFGRSPEISQISGEGAPDPVSRPPLKPPSRETKAVAPAAPQTLADSPWLGTMAGGIIASMVVLAGITFELPWIVTAALGLVVLLVGTFTPAVVRRQSEAALAVLRAIPVAVSRQGRFVATGVDNNLELREVGKSKPDWTVIGHEKPVTAIAFHPDGMRLATGGADNLIHIWNAGTGERLATLRGHTWTIRALTFSPDGRLLASASGDRTIRLWDVSSTSLVSVLAGSEEQVASLAFAPDGATLASGAADRQWRIWNLETNSQESSRPGHRREVSCLAYANDGYRLASGGDDGLVMLWNLQSGKLMTSFTGHSGGVTGVMFSPSGTRLISIGRDGYLRSWDPTTKEETASLRLGRSPLTGLAAPDGAGTLFVTSGSGRLYEVDGLRLRLKNTRVLL